MTSSDRVLEVGCGIGELCKLAPNYMNQIQQTDGSCQIVAEHKKRDADSNVIYASAYKLPFRDREFDHVVGYSSFDVLADIDRATTEMARVICRDGKIIHFLDLQASIHPIFDYYKDREEILFPYSEMIDGVLACTGMQLVSRPDYEIAKKELNEGLIPSFDCYAENPEEQYVFLHKHSELYRVLTYMGRHIADLDIPRKVIRLNDFFSEKLCKSFENAGLELLENGYREGIVERSFDEVPFAIKGKNKVMNNVGSVTTVRDESVRPQPKNAKVVSRLLVCVAQKP